MDLRSYFSLKGRIRRSQYWIYYVIPLNVLGGLVEGFGDEGLLISEILAVLAWLNFTGLTKRLHDLNHSLWLFTGAFACPLGVGAAFSALNQTVLAWIFLAASVFFFLVLSLALAFTPGTKGPNRYGEDPLEGARDRTVGRGTL